MASAIAVAVVVGLVVGAATALVLRPILVKGSLGSGTLILIAVVATALTACALISRKAASRLAGGLVRNLDLIQIGVRRVRAGHLDERVRLDSGDETEDLAEAFNLMTEDLQESIDRLREANRELHVLEQVKVDLVANVSHELRTPLTALKGFLELLDEGELGPLGLEAQRAISVCRRNADRLTMRVDDLVALSQMEQSWPDQLETEPFDLLQLVSMVAEVYEMRTRAKDIRLSVEAPDEISLVAGNEEQIERAVINLLDNAVKFTPNGGEVVLAVEECDHDHREGVLIRVVDSGIGIPGNELVRVFDRFHQVDPSIRRRFGGMGLGLSLVNHIVESHRGVVWAESGDEPGSTFFLWLPSWSPDGDAASGEEGVEDEGQRRPA
jgi:signal transduction histidine kinase